ncbi:relaxase/mobilization nuclease domain-containing protein [Paraburkholderia aspalathi]|nr:relaxase/mobilization nuclease domain-containing protein [Paraburkholderia aspalathi]
MKLKLFWQSLPHLLQLAMLIKFTRGGRGSGRQVAEYLIDAQREGRSHMPPEVVRGDLERTRGLIDSIERQWSYTHGCLSFALEDAPTEQQQREAMDGFEQLAFAGMDPEQYDITWVRHQHTEGGRIELHFVTPRMELNAGKALNVAPPGWESTYRPLRDALNYEHGWASPDDPERTRELQTPSYEPPERLEDREAIHDYLAAMIEQGAVYNRPSLVQALKESGLEVPRQGKDYVTAKDPQSGQRFRLKGSIYEEGWTYDRQLKRTNARALSDANRRDRETDLRRAREARQDLEARIRTRAEFHAGRYPRNDAGIEREYDANSHFGAVVVGVPDAHLDSDRSLDSLDLWGTENGDRALSDVRIRGPEVSNSPRGNTGHDVSERRAEHSLRSPASDGVDEHEPANSLRARIARTIRETGSRLQDLAENVRGHVRSIAGTIGRFVQALEENRGETSRNREFSEQLAKGIERAERWGGQLDRASERVAERVQEIGQEQRRKLDRGADLGW